MKQQILWMTLTILLLYSGQAVLAWPQTPVSTLTTPVVEVVASPTGATVQAAGIGFGSLALGHISWVSKNTQFGVTHAKSGNSFNITTNVSLLLACPTLDSGRRASIKAVLQQPTSRYVVSLDQVTLSAAPATISPFAFCGSTTQHTLSVEVPVSASSGPINANVAFQVTLQ